MHCVLLEHPQVLLYLGINVSDPAEYSLGRTSGKSSPFSPLCRAYRRACLATHMRTLYFRRFSPLRDVMWRQPDQVNWRRRRLRRTTFLNNWEMYKYTTNSFVSYITKVTFKWQERLNQTWDYNLMCFTHNYEVRESHRLEKSLMIMTKIKLPIFWARI